LGLPSLCGPGLCDSMTACWPCWGGPADMALPADRDGF
jgi:hypothetical protein